MAIKVLFIFTFFIFPFLIFGLGIYIGMVIKDNQLRLRELSEPSKISIRVSKSV